MNFQGEQIVSLDLVSTLSIVKNGSVYVYDYYNNIPFNPFSIVVSHYTDNSSWFSNTTINPSQYTSINYVNLTLTTFISFNLSRPTFVEKLNPNNSSGVQSALSIASPLQSALSITSPVPSQSGTYYVPTQYVNITGPFPLVASEISLNDSNAGSYLINAAAYFLLDSATLDLNSNQVIVSKSGEITNEMSTKPAYSTTGFINQEASPDVFPANYISEGKPVGPNYTIAMVYIQNVTIEIIHGNIIYVWTWGSGSRAELLGNYTFAKVSYINTKNGIQLNGSYLPIEVSSVMEKLFNNTVNLGTLSPNQQIQGSTIWYHSQSYSNANSVYQNIADTLITFPASIGVAIAVIDTLSAVNVFGDEAEPEIIADSFSIISHTLALPADVLSLYSSIDFISETNMSGLIY